MAKSAKQKKPARRAGSTGHYPPQAVGSYEAACLMGLHFSQPGKLHAKGRLSAHMIEGSSYVATPSKTAAIYDSRECERDYAEYVERYDSGEHGRRPRAWLHLRPDAVAHLKAVKTPIAFDDAIGVVEATKILGVHPSFVPRMITRGEIVGRQPYSRRGRVARVYIISRRSCIANIKKKRAALAAGGVVGRPRTKLA